MRDEVMHDSPESDFSAQSGLKAYAYKVKAIRPKSSKWNPERFAEEQIRGLVRQVFTAKMTPPVRQIVFSAVEPDVDVRTLCLQVGESLAKETSANIAVLLKDSPNSAEDQTDPEESDSGKERASLRQNARRCGSNLWVLDMAGENRTCATAMQASLARIRTEFWYSILEGPPVGRSDEATAMAQFADGMILVLSALRTRRATAIQVKQTLERSNVRLLGSVLSEREFPIPEGIYRRL
jgi:hypothetical protein